MIFFIVVDKIFGSFKFWWIWVVIWLRSFFCFSFWFRVILIGLYINGYFWLFIIEFDVNNFLFCSKLVFVMNLVLVVDLLWKLIFDSLV